jgi:hypothetical protein
MIVKGFESAFRESLNESVYRDTLKILEISKDTLILNDGEETFILHKK